jgi:adenosylmethionine-8-amino-7-oxononanoate aminotransferase
MRRAAIEGWGLSLTAAHPLSRADAARAITSAGRRNHEGMLEPFCVAIGHAADDYVELLKKAATRAKYARNGKRRKKR